MTPSSSTCVTTSFPKAVADLDGGRDFVAKEIAGMRQDGGDTGAHVLVLDQGDMSHPDAAHVRDGIERAGLVDPRRKAKIAGAWPPFSGQHEQAAKAQDGEKKESQAHNSSRGESFSMTCSTISFGT